MKRILLGAVAVCIIVSGRFIFIPVDSALGPLLTYGSVIAFFVWCHWIISSGIVRESARSSTEDNE